MAGTHSDGALRLWGGFWIDNHDSLLDLAENEVHMSIVGLEK